MKPEIIYNGFEKKFTVIGKDGKKHTVFGQKAVLLAKFFLTECNNITEQKKSSQNANKRQKTQMFNFKNIKI